jgi:hypothetical protein
MTLEDLEMKIRALPGVASDPHTVPALVALVLEYVDAARPAKTGPPVNVRGACFRCGHVPHEGRCTDVITYLAGLEKPCPCDTTEATRPETSRTGCVHGGATLLTWAGS